VKIEINKLLIHEDSTIREAMKAISLGEIGVALSVERDTGKFIRTITDGDIRRMLLNGFGLQSPIEVIEYVKTTVVQIDTPASEISSLFSDKIRAIPVVDDNNQVVDLHFYDKRNHIAVAKPLFDDKEIEFVNDCMVSGWVSSGGKFVTQFEEMMARYTNNKYAISCSSGTSALHLILMAYGVGRGDEVIIPSLTFIATANAVSYTGATPVFVDSDIETWNIDPKKIENIVTKKTKAIIPVHLYGHPADMDPINKIAAKHNLKVIEDAAEAHGACYKGEMVGSLANAAIFSFFGNKVITTGEGGMVVTNDSDIAKRCRLLRDHGMDSDRRYWHKIIGYNYRMTNIQAAIGVAQMNKINTIIEKKRWIANEYKKYLFRIDGVQLPPDIEWAKNIFWLYTILIDSSKLGFDVHFLMSELKKNKIDSRIVFYPIHTQPIYKCDTKFPVAERIHSRGISLPSSPEMTKKDIDYICSVLTDLCV